MLASLGVSADAMVAGMCLFTAALLSSGRPPWRGRARGLALFMLIAGLASINDVLLAAGVQHVAPHFIGFNWPFAMLQGPAIYAYVRAMTHPQPPRRAPRDLALLGWPFLLGVVLATPFYMLDGPAKVDFMARGEAGLFTDRSLPALGVLAIISLSLLISLAWLVVAFRLLWRHMRRVRDLFSNIEDKSLSWVRWVLLILSVAWLWGATKSGGSLLGVAPAWQEAVASALELGWLGTLCYFGVLQKPVFEAGPAPHAAVAEAAAPAGGPAEAQPVAKYSRSALDAERMARIADKLRHAMEQERLFADPSLSLRDLADRLGVSENYISQTLNDQLGRNFFDFVNAARIEAAKPLLREAGRTVLEVAMSVGFNSRSTFNAAFRKHAGDTPSRFRAAN
jgi:AraC-like DNA-binding protein